MEAMALVEKTTVSSTCPHCPLSQCIPAPCIMHLIIDVHAFTDAQELDTRNASSSSCIHNPSRVVHLHLERTGGTTVCSTCT